MNVFEFNTFFNDSKVDTPICLLASGSSRRSINKHLLLKFSNYIMRKGNRQQVLNMLINAIRLSYNRHIINMSLSENYLN